MSGGTVKGGDRISYDTGMPAEASSGGRASVAAWLAEGAASCKSNVVSLGAAPAGCGWEGCCCPST